MTVSSRKNNIFFSILLVFLSWMWADFSWSQKKPLFEHTPPSESFENKELVIQGTFKHFPDLDSSFLFYRVMGSKLPFQKVLFIQKGKLFVATIASENVKAPGIDYYVMGNNFDGRSFVLAGSEKLPLQIIVIRDFSAIGKPKVRKETPFKETEILSKEKGSEVLTSPSITTPTGKKRWMSQEPFTTTVVTSDEIETYGFRDITDLLFFQAGMDVNLSGLFPDFGFRGINALGSQGRGIMIRIDGEDLSYRQKQSSPLSAALISIDNIDRIEMIRGSVSSLFAGNASYGLLNIVTKSGKKLNGVSATLGMAPQSGSHFFTVRGGKAFSNGLDFYSSFSMTKDIRSPLMNPLFEFFTASKGLQYISPNEQALSRNIMTKLSWKGLFLDFHHSFYNAQTSLHPDSILGGDDTSLSYERWYFRTGWAGKISKTAQLEASLSYHQNKLLPGSAVEINPLKPTANSSTWYELSKKEIVNGTETTVFFGFFPSCQETSTNTTQGCVSQAGVKIDNTDSQNVCLLQPNSTQALPTNVTTAEKHKTWFPLSECKKQANPTGRTLESLQGGDQRVELNVKIQWNPIQNLRIGVGLQFEYDWVVLEHYTQSWKKLGQEQESPSITNYRMGGNLLLEYLLSKKFLFHFSGRVDYEESYGISWSPHVAFVANIREDWFAKLHYTLSQKTPSFTEIYSVNSSLFGNPTLQPEMIHAIGLQAGWWRKNLALLSISGFMNLSQNTMTPVFHKDGKLISEERFPKTALPTGSFTQMENVETGRMTFGTEIEAKLFPWKGLQARAFLGLALTSETVAGTAQRIPYSAGLYAGVLLAYQYKFFQISTGFQFAGSKSLVAQDYVGGDVLPNKDLPNKENNPTAPSWTASNDPRGTDDLNPFVRSSMQLFMTAQFNRLFGHFDLVLQVRNLEGLGTENYSAGAVFLYPHKKTEAWAWIKTRF